MLFKPRWKNVLLSAALCMLFSVAAFVVAQETEPATEVAAEDVVVEQVVPSEEPAIEVVTEPEPPMIVVLPGIDDKDMDMEQPLVRHYQPNHPHSDLSGYIYTRRMNKEAFERFKNTPAGQNYLNMLALQQHVNQTGMEQAGEPIFEEQPKEEKPEVEIVKPLAVIEKEQTVYVPYEKLKNAFEAEGRGVFLPYAEFRKLWDAANQAAKKQPEPEPVKAPVPAMITETENVARINGDLIEVSATVRFDLLEPGWHQLPLQLQQAAIIAADIDGQPAQILGDNQNGYTLLVSGGQGLTALPYTPVRGELSLKYAKTYDKSPGRNSVAFNVPQAPMSRWEFRVPDADVKVDFLPMIAASEMPAEDGSQETVFRAFAGSAPTVQIGWTPKAEGATGLEALANVQTQQRMVIEEGVVRNRVNLLYTISRAQLDKLAVEVPDDQKITGVIDDNVRSWNISQGENVQVINVELFEPAKATQRLQIEMEKFVPVADELTIAVPRIKVIGVSGHQGILAVDASPGWACEQRKTSGLIQIDPGELPQTLRIRDGGFAYRLSAPAYSLELAVEKEQPRIFARSQVQVTLDPNAENITMFNAYRIEKAGVFQLFYDIPADYTVLSVQPYNNITRNSFILPASENPATGNQANDNPAANMSPVVIDGTQVSDLPDEEGKPKMKRLTVNLARKAIGTFGVQVRLQWINNREELRGDTEKAVDVKIVSPIVSAEGIEQKEGLLIFSAPESLRVTETGFSGMQNVSFDQLADKWVTANQQPGNLAYVFASEQPELSLSVMRRMPQVTIGQLLSVRIDDGVARFSDKISYNVLYSGVKSLRMDVPQEISDIVRNQTSEFRDTILSPQPDDVAEGYVAWNFERGNELLGNGTIMLTWEKQVPQLMDGSSVAIAIPRLVPYKVFRSWGQIVLSKAETVDLSAADINRGLRQIDPQHDPIIGNERVPDAAYAFEFHDEWELTLNATRYELQEVKRASIEYGLLRVVLTRANTQAVQALYRIQSVKQRLPIILPDDAMFDIEPRINGVPVKLETSGTGEDQYYLIPLTSTVPDTPFLLELRYTQKQADAKPERNAMKIRERISLPRFPDEPAVQHVYAAVYIPEEYALTSYKGNCSKNFVMVTGGDKNRIGTINMPGIDTIMQNIQRGMSQQTSWQDYPVDGVPYLFSTVQPDPESSKLLTLKMRKISCINVFMFAILLAGGIVLTFYNWRIRGIAVFGVIALYALLAFVAPTLMYVVGVMTGVRWAIMLVILAWVIWSFLRGWDTFKKIMTTPFFPKKQESQTEVKAEVVPEMTAENANSDDQPKNENAEGGRHE